MSDNVYQCYLLSKICYGRVCFKKDAQSNLHCRGGCWRLERWSWMLRAVQKSIELVRARGGQSDKGGVNEHHHSSSEAIAEAAYTIALAFHRIKTHGAASFLSDSANLLNEGFTFVYQTRSD